ncbi:MAG: hypothetical protein ABIG90_02935 [bacterium]
MKKIGKGDKIGDKMQFIVPKSRENILTLIRQLGYRPLPSNQDGEFNCVRSLSGLDYPRFHLHVKNNNNLIFNLHLDQKKPSYAGSSAHSGEYDGELVEKEAERIKSFMLVIKI